MNEYRAGAAISDRSEAKRRRAYAESVLAYTTAVAEQSVRSADTQCLSRVCLGYHYRFTA